MVRRATRKPATRKSTRSSSTSSPTAMKMNKKRSKSFAKSKKTSLSPKKMSVVRAKAAANTKPMTFYFSASPSPSKSPTTASSSPSSTANSKVGVKEKVKPANNNSKKSSSSSGTRHRLAALSPNVLDRKNNSKNINVNVDAKLNKKRSGNETSKDSNSSQQPQQSQPSVAKKRKTTIEIAKTERSSGMVMGTSPKSKSKSLRPRNSEISSKTIRMSMGSSSGMGGSASASASVGVGASKSKECKQVPSTLFPDPKSPTCNPNAKPGIQNAASTTTKSHTNTNTNKNVQLSLGLIRVQKADSSLLESCLLLKDPSGSQSSSGSSSRRTIYPLTTGTILGRNEKKPKPNKTLIDIPSSDNGISRKQLEVVQIKHKNFSPESADATPQVDIDPGTIDANSTTGRLSNYLHKSQRRGPTLEIMCSKSAMNAVLIVRAQAMDMQSITPSKRISHPTKSVGRGERCVLNVGDVIVFDPFQKKTGGEPHEPQHHFMVVSFNPDDDQQLANTSTSTRKKRPCIDLTSETSVSEVKQKLVSVPVSASAKYKSDTKRTATKLSSVRSRDEDKVEDKDAPSEDSSEVVIEVVPPRQKSTRNANATHKVINPRIEKEPVAVAVVKKNQSPEVVTVSESAGIVNEHEHDVVVKIIQEGMEDQSTTASLDTNIIAGTGAIKLESKHEHETCPAPNVGDMFCVLFPFKDLFTKQKNRKRFIGTVTGVKNTTSTTGGNSSTNTYLLTICYGDKKVTEEKYPRNVIQQIYRRPETSIYETKGSTSNGVTTPSSVVYDTNPAIVVVGDYVECNYQNGLHDDVWYYGRIAAVSSDGKTADVAYFDDRTYEEGVPIGLNHIRLVERGSFQASKWLSNAMFTDPSSSSVSSRKSKILKVYCKDVDVDPDKDSNKDCSNDLVCTVKRPQGGRPEEISYQSAVKLLFSQYRESCIRDGKVVSWPTITTPLSLNQITPDSPVSEINHEAKDDNKMHDYLEAPGVGDLIRVLYKEERGIFTGLKEEVSCVATVLSIKKPQGKGKGKKHLITIEYNDHKVEEIEYPNDEMERIMRKGNRRSSTFETLDGAFAYDENPKHLAIGDFVECLYQNGQSNGMWFTGRVGNVSSDGDTIDVAYFDDEYETNIPVQKGFVHLLSRGSRLPNNWLPGAEYSGINEGKFKVLKVCSQSKSSILECTTDEDHSNDLYCVVRASDGAENEVPYIDVLAALFSQAREEKSLKVWPGANIERPLVPAPSDVSPKISNPFTSFTNSSDCDGEDLNMSQDSLPGFSFCDDEEANGLKVANLKPALANTCWRAFESSEPYNGYGMLTHMEASMNLVPNHQLASFLSDFLGLGPQFEGIQIQDPFRTELVTKYCQRITSITHGEDSNNKMIFSICPSTFDKLSDLLSLPTNAEDGGPCVESMSASYIRRLSRSLQHCARALTFVSTSFGMETKEVIEGVVEQVDPSALSRMPFTSLFLESPSNHGNNIRSSLKLVVQKAIRCLLWHGHWLVGNSRHSGGDGRRVVDEQHCAVETKACSKALCQIVSRVAWLYCAKEESSFPHNDCCFIIRDAMESEFSAFDYSLLSKNGKQVSSKVRHEYKRDVTLYFLLFLQSDFSMSVELQTRLSDLFEVSTLLSVLQD